MKTLTAALLAAGLSTAAFAGAAMAASAADCTVSWNLYDVNREGRLSGAQAERFVDDMRAKGIVVTNMRHGTISAKQYNDACIKEFWELQEQNSY